MDTNEKEEDWKGRLDPDVRRAFHEIRDIMAVKFTQTELNTARINRLESMMTEHIKNCDANKEAINTVTTLMQEIKISYRWSNRIRGIFMFFAPPAAAVYAAWKTWKGL